MLTEVTILYFLAAFAVLAGTFLIMCGEWAMRPGQVAERQATPTLQRTGLIIASLAAAGMGLLWHSWAGRFPQDAPFAMWGTLLAAGGLLLIALKPSALRASIGLVLALIPPAFIWLYLTIGSECSRAGCSWAQEVSVFPPFALLGLAVILFVLELAAARHKPFASARSGNRRSDPARTPS